MELKLVLKQEFNQKSNSFVQQLNYEDGSELPQEIKEQLEFLLNGGNELASNKYAVLEETIQKISSHAKESNGNFLQKLRQNRLYRSLLNYVKRGLELGKLQSSSMPQRFGTKGTVTTFNNLKEATNGKLQDVGLFMTNVNNKYCVNACLIYHGTEKDLVADIRSGAANAAKEYSENFENYLKAREKAGFGQFINQNVVNQIRTQNAARIAGFAAQSSDSASER